MSQTVSYPCHECKMGNWTYYITQLPMADLHSLIKKHKDIFEKSNRRLSGWMQRDTESRKGLLKYISQREDRFFSSIVVGFQAGRPEFIPLEPSNMKDDENLKHYFGQYTGVKVGVLQFYPDPNRKMYAIDGQHRLLAIGKMLDPEFNDYPKPDGFENEIVSVIFVPLENESEKDGEQRYRRLFSSLNRYAKPTGQMMDIIMDDDDIFAILTRRLYEEHPFFEAGDHESTSFVAIKKGSAMSKSDDAFTNLITFYKFITKIFSNVIKLQIDQDKNLDAEIKAYMQKRPDEDQIDHFYEILSMMWDAITNCFPEFGTENSGDSRDPNKEKFANFLFTPIGQLAFGDLIRIRTERLDFSRHVSEESFMDCIKVLAEIPWKMREKPWEGLVCVKETSPDGQQNWKMINEGRSEAIKLVMEICEWLIGEIDLNENEISELKSKWQQIGNTKSDKEAEECFSYLMELQSKISQ